MAMVAGNGMQSRQSVMSHLGDSSCTPVASSAFGCMLAHALQLCR
eukprot:CAMPEP_0175156956 /NCGR_PEP_ID=MMETSP0087-20121206/21916_1 /TAXON_ID=136419 /ORGANISM="Unknown Unknown, Strain D1" /LENGTH=44 /DNA_ID= /DNA_START= /DNA_END= /DNA_ORIENTATION=